jgi:hypothetical protein
MRLWLVCCVLMFSAAQGYQWIGQQSWFTDPGLSLPWLILGGAGLAIASNLSMMRQFQLPLAHPSPPTLSASPSEASDTLPSPSGIDPPPPGKAQVPKQSSISFEIPKKN